MANTQQPFDEPMLLAAADWWTRLRDPRGAEASVEQWLDWTARDERHLAAFEYVSAFGARLGRLDATARRQLLGEFAPVAAPHRRWLPMAAAASVAALLVAGGCLLWWGRVAGNAVVQATYASSTGQNRDIVLADGSRVALGGASRLSVRFTAGQRLATLEAGEAYFQVKHDARHPFEVVAGGITVHDIGTAFDVRRSGGEVAVAVTEGQVRVAAAGDAANTLDAGAEQRVVWNAATHALSLGTTTPEQAAGWRGNRLEFVDEPLAVVLASVNRYSDRPVRLEGADLAGLSFTGTVHADDIDGWLRALPQVFPLQVAMGEHAVTLSANTAATQRH
ncbi:FecR domain-containing protein [Rhodanobacter sp. DHB23]|uniref:FecR family protein n=1 Tax=Rhodanobacter sp. DHB23 TaxID=2775923 RepID=UPI0017800F36|nr:FecR domain-containing protein [Rhodanobacter sp. DHB23]MBD8873945.1 FecR domain-containing protein [Rhodanobacter sp. DHB23]